MKSTGVIRRIDELGRIVIPKEIRRNLGIHDGENLEIYIENDYIILKKHCRLTSNVDLASNLCDLTYNLFNYKTIITDREKIIASSGIENNLLNKKLPKEYETILEKRETKEVHNFKIDDFELNCYISITPIISLNDSIGLVIIASSTKSIDIESIGKLISSIFTKKLDI